jgi:hypothetical protein
MSRRKSKLQTVAAKRPPASSNGPAKTSPRVAPDTATQRAEPGNESARRALPQVSGRWLLKALAGTLAGAVLCVWGALCLLFWQGSWQLLYHPSAAITRTPASAGLAFDSVGFAASASGTPSLNGWWIPAAPGTLSTVLYLHDRDGNLSGTVDQLAQLHAAGVNVFAFDYRGYGQSQFAHPSEKHWLEDADSAFQYLTATRHIDPRSLVVDGRGLGADLALEFAAAHPHLAGVVADSPLQDAAGILFNDARARLVPAHSLASDRWDLAAAAESLRVPSLWFLPFPGQPQNGTPAQNPPFFKKVTAPKMFVWLPPGQATTVSFPAEFSRWLDTLSLNTPVPNTPGTDTPSPATPQSAPQKPKSTRRPAHRHHAHH